MRQAAPVRWLTYSSMLVVSSALACGASNHEDLFGGPKPNTAGSGTFGGEGGVAGTVSDGGSSGTGVAGTSNAGVAGTSNDDASAGGLGAGAGSAGVGGGDDAGDAPIVIPRTVRCGQTECSLGSGEQCCARTQESECFNPAQGETCTCTLAICVPAQCDGPADCAPGQKCCSSFAGYRCRDACAANDIEICRNDADCSGNGSCATRTLLLPGFLGCGQ